MDDEVPTAATGTPRRANGESCSRRIWSAPPKILDRLRTDPALAGTTELRLELPYGFHRVDYEQILHDTVEYIAPALGWQPSPELV
ncbi:hypothetical protein AB0M34_33545 [Nocardia sp. NPDC050193]